MPILEILTGPTAGQCYELLSDQVVIGRLPFCELVIPSKTISRQHSRISRTPDGYFLEDLGSINGTHVNGVRVQGRVRLEHLDRIQLYDVALRYHVGPIDPQRVARDVEEAKSAAAAMTPSSPDPQPETIVHTLDAAAPVAASAEARLKAVLAIIRDLGSSLAVEDMLSQLLDSLFALFTQAERGHVLLAVGPQGDLMPRALKENRKAGDGNSTLRPINRKVANRVMSERQAILIDTASSPVLAADDSVLEDRRYSLMCAPLMEPSGRPVGVIHLESDDAQRPFTREDLEVLVSVATVAGRAIGYSREHETRLRLERRAQDLTQAREVQKKLLSRVRPRVIGYRFFDFDQPADEVGGDYLGYLELQDGRLAIAVGDVAGKGFPAALLMAQLASEARYRLAVSQDPQEALRGLNQWLAHMDDRFVTLVLAVLDPKQHTLTIVNAGHMPPLRRSAAGVLVEELGGDELGNPPLGVDPHAAFQPCTISLAPGDVVAMYTDGISEARSSGSQTFGMARLRQAFGEGPPQVERLGPALLSAVEQFRAGLPQSDDICLVCLSRQAP